MEILQITFDTVINVNSVITVSFFSALFAMLNKHWKKINRMHLLHRMQLEAIIYANYMSFGENLTNWKHHYEEKIEELMKKHNFTDGK